MPSGKPLPADRLRAAAEPKAKRRHWEYLRGSTLWEYLWLHQVQGWAAPRDRGPLHLLQGWAAPRAGLHQVQGCPALQGYHLARNEFDFHCGASPSAT